MPTTANLALPYPVLADTADVPRDIQALADQVELRLSEPIVTTLPTTNLFNGKTVLYQFATPANQPVGNAAGVGGGLWRLRYDTAVTDAYKWRWLGGADWTTVATYTWGPSSTTAETVDPQLQYPVVLPGYYDVWAKVLGTIVFGGFSENYRKWGLAVGSSFDFNETNMKGNGWTSTAEFVMTPIRPAAQPAGALIHARWQLALTNDTIMRNPGSILYVRPHRVGP